MVLTKMQSAIVDLINSMQIGAGKSHLVAYLYVNDENAKSIVEDWVARQNTKESPENSPASPVQQSYGAICGQKLSCRFQQFADKIRCGAPAAIDCRHKQHQ